MPSREQEAFERAAATYDRVAFSFFGSFGEALVAFAELSLDEAVLDAGCGTGAVLAPAAEVAANVTGIELSPAMAERAREAVPSAEIVVGDAAQLPFEDASFDVVLSSFVVFFIANPTAALREWRRVLRPGGRLVMATWGAPDRRWTEWERPLRRPYVAEMEPEVQRELMTGLPLLDRFSESSKVAAELELAGFAVDDVREHTIEFVFPDADAWWQWNNSHGVRMFLDALPDDALARMKADYVPHMERLRDDRGYPRKYTALFAKTRMP